MATHYSILAWEIPWTEEPGSATVHEVTESDLTEQLRTHTHTHPGIGRRILNHWTTREVLKSAPFNDGIIL